MILACCSTSANADTEIIRLEGVLVTGSRGDSPGTAYDFYGYIPSWLANLQMLNLLPESTPWDGLLVVTSPIYPFALVDRLPACLNEQIAATASQAATVAAVATNSPSATATFVPVVLTDPHFGNGQWLKWQDTFIFHEGGVGGSPIIERRVTLHYNRNIATNQIADYKFVTQPETGCGAGTIA